MGRGSREELRIRLLGDFELLLGDREMTGLPHSAELLLAYLVYTRNQHTKSDLGYALWPEKSVTERDRLLAEAIEAFVDALGTEVLHRGESVRITFVGTIRTSERMDRTHLPTLRGLLTVARTPSSPLRLRRFSARW